MIDDSHLVKTNELFEKCKSVIAGGESSYARLSSTRPIVMSHGKGTRFWDVDGNEYLDWCLGYGPMIFGHCPERINAAVVKQISEKGSMYTFPHELDYEVGRKICQAVPSVDLVRFCNSGTEATMAAMRLARAYTGKDKILKFEGGYHGWSDANALAYHPPLDNCGPERAPWPVRFHAGIPRVQEECLVIATYNDFEGVERLVRENAGELAGIIAEPIMANSGVIPPLPGWNQHLRKLCDEYGLLLIFDEVITGFRMALGGCQELYGVNADITTWGKAIGGGFPCAAAFGGTKEVMDVETRNETFHGGTYSANPPVLAAMNAALDIFIDEGDTVYPHLKKIADALCRRSARGVRRGRRRRPGAAGQRHVAGVLLPQAGRALPPGASQRRRVLPPLPDGDAGPRRLLPQLPDGALVRVHGAHPRRRRASRSRRRRTRSRPSRQKLGRAVVSEH